MPSALRLFSSPALLAVVSLPVLAGCSEPSPVDPIRTTPLTETPLKSAPHGIHSASDSLSMLTPVAASAAAADPTAPPAQTASPFSVGFSSIDLTWRAGAKPGQVGTEANISQMARLYQQVASLLLPAYRLQRQDKTIELLETATDWTLDLLEQRLQEIRYDKYSDVYQPGRGLHTRTAVKALVAERDGKKVAIVSADLYLMQKTLWRKVADLVATETGLAPEQILIAATHNHSAADAAFTQGGISMLAETFDPRHFAFIAHQVAEAIKAADRARVPARMGAIQSTLRAVQRNIIGPATASVVPPGETQPQTVSAGYPRSYFDDGLWILTFDDAQTGQHIGASVIFGMHPESLEEGHGLLSSDFVGPLQRGLEERWGFPVMWLPGALGDIEQDDGSNFGTDYWREDFVRLQEQAATLVNEIGPLLEQAPAPGDLVLSPRADIVVDSRTHIFPGANNTSYPSGTAWQLPVTEYLSPEFPVTCVRALTESANIALQAIRLGDVVLFGSPSEVTTDMARHIRSRTDDIEGNLFQGYVWPDAEAWVEEEISQNFDSSELSAATGFAMPILISQANDYLGYMVTRWEFNNRDHYRQSMTLYGEDTANYVAARFEELSRELRGASPTIHPFDAPSEADFALEDQVYDFVAGLDPWVTEWARSIPSNEAALIGRVLKAPTFLESDEMGVPSVRFGWRGGSSDLPVPSVTVERSLGNGVWQKLADERDTHVWLLYEPGGAWEVVWHLLDAPGSGEYRFVVRGLYRGTQSGISTPDPLWDPDGKNVPFNVVSVPITVP